jgi:hypothetical protein
VSSRTGATSDGSTRRSVGSRSPTKAGSKPMPAPAKVAAIWTCTLVDPKATWWSPGDAGEQVEIFDAEQALDVEDQRVLGEVFDRFWCAVVDFVVSSGVQAELVVGELLRPGPHHDGFSDSDLGVGADAVGAQPRLRDEFDDQVQALAVRGTRCRGQRRTPTLLGRCEGKLARRESL